MRMRTRFLLAVCFSFVPLTYAAATFAADAPAKADKPAEAKATAVPSSTVGATPRKIYGHRKVVKDGEEYYCKREKSTGSRVRSAEVCMTRRQIDLLATASRDALDDLSRTPTGDAYQDGRSDAPAIGASQMGPMPITTYR